MGEPTAQSSVAVPMASAPALADDLVELLDRVGDPAALRKWCERAVVLDVNTLMDVDLMSAPLHKLHRWAGLQASLRALRRLAPACAPADFDRRIADGLGSPDLPVGPALRAALQRPAPPAAPLSPREALQLLGGIAGARALAERMAEAEQTPPKIRQVRDRLRNTGDAIRKLGAGYYASAARRADPVATWAEDRVGRLGREPLPSFLKATLDAYPHGDAHAIAAWLHQSPGRLVVRRGMVCYVEAAVG